MSTTATSPANAPVKTSNSDSYYRWVGDGNRVHPGSSYRDANSGDCDYRLTTNQPRSQFEPKRTFHRSKRMSLAAVCEQNHAVGNPTSNSGSAKTCALPKPNPREFIGGLECPQNISATRWFYCNLAGG